MELMLKQKLDPFQIAAVLATELRARPPQELRLPMVLRTGRRLIAARCVDGPALSVYSFLQNISDLSR